MCENKLLTTIKPIQDIPILRIVQVQSKTHKKKRINKKWLKRYGYRYEMYLNGKLVNRNVKLDIQSTSSKCYPSPYALYNSDFGKYIGEWCSVMVSNTLDI